MKASLLEDAPPAPPQQADLACLRELESQGVAYQRAAVEGGMRTPVEVTGRIGGVALVPRGHRPALMDCVLASALAHASSIFQELGITELAFSAAFDNRTRRGSTEASGHAYGLAIDVHVIRGGFGEYDVRQYFERGVGVWRGLGRGPEARDAGDACVGQPVTPQGRLLRQLACGLKLHPAFRVIVTPDDDADHQDHLHLEARASFFPPAKDAPPLPPPAAPAPAPQRTTEDTQTATAPPHAKPKRVSRSRKKKASKKKPSKKQLATINKPLKVHKTGATKSADHGETKTRPAARPR